MARQRYEVHLCDGGPYETPFDANKKCLEVINDMVELQQRKPDEAVDINVGIEQYGDGYAVINRTSYDI